MENKVKGILIADDVEWNRALLEELFCKQYQILEASDGQEALDIYHANKSRISIVLLDTIMPVLDGFGFLEELNRTGEIRDIPVVIVTSDTTAQVDLRGYELGASEIIKRPYDANAVWHHINNLVELHEYRNGLEQKVQDMAKELDLQNKRMNQTNLFVIDALCTAVEFRDSESGLHISRLRDLTRILLTEWGNRNSNYKFAEDELDMICIAAAMHDIGKIAIPDDVLKKPGRLTREEFEIMKTHTVRGCNLLEQLDYVKTGPHYQYCYDICRYHHERYDGNGYPEGLSGDEIPIWAQVVSLADVYDALVSSRVYKPSYNHEDAANMIFKGNCGVFNPELLECFKSQQKNLAKLYQGPIQASRFDSLKPKVFLTDEKQIVDPSERIVRLLEVERAKYRILEENTGEIVFDYEVRSETLNLSERFQEIFDYPLQITGFKKVWEESPIIYESDKKVYEEISSEIKKKRPLIRKRLRLRTKKGKYEWFEILLCGLWDMDNGNVCMDLVGKIVNIDEWKKDAEIWRHQASHDFLTDLYSRGAFEDLINEILGEEIVQPGILMFLDVDNFKQINDENGHPFGDRVLQYVANILVGCFRSTDIIARFGGDEFVMYLRELSSREVLKRKLILLYEQFSNGYQENSIFCELSASIGIVTVPQNGVEYKELINCADQALYKAKTKGGNCYMIYDSLPASQKFYSRVEEN